MSILRTWRKVRAIFKFQFCGPSEMKVGHGRSVYIVRFSSSMNQRDPQKSMYRGSNQMGVTFAVGRQLFIYIIWEAEADPAISTVKQRAVVCGLEEERPAFEPGPDMEICSVCSSSLPQCRWTPPLSSQLSPYGSSLGCSLETPYGI